MSDIIKKVEGTIMTAETTAKTWWSVILEFFTDKDGKFSHKRLIALALAANGIIMAWLSIKADSHFGGWLAAAQIAGAIILGVISAVTKT